MSIRKCIPAVLLSLTCTFFVHAQNTNSTYSRFGYGLLETPAMGMARGMGSLGYGLHDRGLLNILNPASIADTDTLNMLFDMGVSGQFTTFKESGSRQYNPNMYLDHVGIKFALKPRWGVALGMVPFSKVGYQFSQEYSLEGTPVGDLEYTTTYLGTGGLSTFFLGTGYSPFKGFSIGATFKYHFGVLENDRSTTYTTSGPNDEMNYNYLFLRIPGIDLGIQQDLKLSSKSYLTLGATAGISLPQSGELYNVNISSDTTETTDYYDYSLPTTLGVGVSYHWDNRFILGLDFESKQFSSVRFQDSTGTFRNQTRVAVGMEYLPALVAEHYYQAIRYRAGLQYTDWYLRQPGHLKSISLSLGAGLPLRGQKSMVNLSLEAGRLLTPDASFIGETYYKASVAVSFNELWFMKLKL